MNVVTRFAPSPTGFLHIGGARTALFNWLFTRHHGGEFRLRIEDTDRKRSTDAAIDAILAGMGWLGLDWDGEVVFQSHRAAQHVDAAERLLAEGKAYLCYCSQEELEEMRQTARAEGRPMRYDGRWRDRDPSDAPSGIDPVVRIKMPQEGETRIQDAVQGDVTVQNVQLDDFVLLRADKSPTYMLSVVVDDHDMGVTDIVRGDDHLNNAFRQHHLFKALGFEPPRFAHIPLIHGPDGAKLSKRHGALGVEAYRDLGYLPEAMRNYLLRLGWGHGDDEIIPTDKAIEWFDLKAVGRSAARFDFDKLNALNAHYLKNTEDARLVDLIAPRLETELQRQIVDGEREGLTRGMPGLKQRARTVAELAENALFYVRRPSFPLANPKAAKLLTPEALELLGECAAVLEGAEPWNEETLEAAFRDFAESRELGFGKIAQPLRAALTGSNSSPGIFEVVEVLGRDECIVRIHAAAEGAAA